MRIKHYIGLIGWENLNFNKDDYVFCDSIVLFYLARIFGKKLEFLPGPKMVANRNFSNKSIFLLPHEIKSLKNMKKYILPNYKEDKSIIDTRDLTIAGFSYFILNLFVSYLLFN